MLNNLELLGVKLVSQGLTIAILAASPAAASQTGTPIDFGDWAAVCDNGWRCEARLVNPLPLKNPSEPIRILRDAGPDGQLQLMIDTGSAAEDGKGFQPQMMQVTGPADIAKQMPDPIERHFGAVYSGDTAASLLRTIAQGDGLRLFTGMDQSVTLRTRGLMAVLAYFDTVQHRIGNESAILATGSAPRVAVPQPPLLPVVKASVKSAKPPRELSKAQLLRERRTFSCSKGEPFAKTTQGADYYRLDENMTLALVMPMCPGGNYNNYYRAILIDEAGDTRLAPIEGDSATAAKAESFPYSDWDSARRRLFSFVRWNANCGRGEEYLWDGKMLRMVRQTETASCNLEIYTALTAWRTVVIEE